MALITPGSGGGTGAGTLGASTLVYRKTIVGADAASIDTGVDAPDAGSNDWTNGDLLEIFITAKTDDAGALAAVNLTVNNDTGNNYDIQKVEGSSATASAASSVAAAAWIPRIHGAGGTAGYPATYTLQFPTFAGTTFNKSANVIITTPDGTAANQTVDAWSFGWRSTAAITRFKIAAQGAAKLKVGTQLLVYKRLTS